MTPFLPQPKGPSRLDEKLARQQDTRRLDAAFRSAVWRRDNGLCRVCGRKVKRTFELNPLRGEVHHLARRSDQAVKFDRRNAVLVCLQDHQRLTLHTLTIVPASAHWFDLDGRRYLDADYLLEFR